ncbi:MAG: hypothetical protein U0R52_01645 [Solirubrobacterales bacterium]
MRRSTTKGRLAGLAATAAILFCAWAPGAAAAPRFETVSATAAVTGPPLSKGSATARCPAGTRVIGGGYDSTDSLRPDGSGSGLLVFSSRRVSRRAWRVAAFKAGSSGGRLRLTAVARCGSYPGPLRARSASVEVPGPTRNVSPRWIAASCPDGTFPVSGGFGLTLGNRTGSQGLPPAFVLGSAATPRGWRAVAARISSPGSSKLTAIAYCGRQRTVTRAKSAIFRAGSVPHRLVTSRCPYGTEAVAGGFLAHLPMGPAPGIMFTLTSSLAGHRHWELTGLAVNSRSFLTSYAYCL